jgi:hypothetical protein
MYFFIRTNKLYIHDLIMVLMSVILKRGGYILWAGWERTELGIEIDIENASGTTWFVEKRQLLTSNSSPENKGAGPEKRYALRPGAFALTAINCPFSPSSAR